MIKQTAENHTGSNALHPGATHPEAAGQSITDRIASIAWEEVAASMHGKGYALLRGLLTEEECNALIAGYDDAQRYRKTITMERYRFGLGEYKYFNYPLPALVGRVRGAVYPYLTLIANAWMEALKIYRTYPSSHEEFLHECLRNRQQKATPLILKYGKGGHNTLHQDLYGDVYFPIQMVVCLSQPDRDFKGGEFVITQQTPRAQSKASVLRPEQGDALLFTTNFKPVKGSKGYYRATMKHGVSEVHSGERYTLGIIFHDAQT